MSAEPLLHRAGPLTAFNDVAAWIADMAVQHNAPGLMMGLSGTDSIVSFLACAKAFNELGKPDRVVGIHYGAAYPPAGKTPEMIAQSIEILPSFMWFPRVILPWLQKTAPNAQILHDSSIGQYEHELHWANLFKRSLDGAMRREAMPDNHGYWIVGTRNATEDALGTYSNLSKSASVEPIINLYKSEVLEICRALGVPEVAINQSRQVDCDCGRFDIAANHIEEVDAVLLSRRGKISRDLLEKKLGADLLGELEKFVEDQIRYAGFKKQIPYTPSLP